MPSSGSRSEEHTSELQSQFHLVCRLLLEKKKQILVGCEQLLIHEFQLLVLVIDFISSLVASSSSFADVSSSFEVSTSSTVFFLYDTATTEIYTLSLHDALPI